MKKLFYICLVCLVACFWSCRDENYVCFSPTDGTNLPEQAIAGTYEGTFTRVNSGDTSRAEGKMVLSPSDTAYCVNIGFVCEGFNLNVSVRLNSFALNNGYYAFETNDITNNLESKIIGSVTPNGDIESAFVYKQRSGRKTIKFDYSFAGSRH